MSQQALIDAIQNLTDQIDQNRQETQDQRRSDRIRRNRERREREKNSNALIQLSQSIVNFYNPVNQLKKAVMDQDKITVKALASNFNLTKVLDKNAKILSDTTANLIEFKSALQDAYSRGVRESTESVNKLTERMIKTGQNTTQLNMLNAELTRVTGGNTETLEKNAASIEKYGKLGQISSERLIESLRSLSKEREELSIFGPQAVEGFNQAVTAINARAGMDMSAQLAQVMSILQPTVENVQQLARLGFDGTAITNQIAQGKNVEKILIEVSKRITDIAKVNVENATMSRNEAQGLTELNSQQLAAAKQLAENSKNQLKLDKDLASAAGEEDKTVKAIRDASQKYYNEIAPAIRDGIVSMGDQLALMLPLLGAGQSLGGMMPMFGGGGGGGGGTRRRNRAKRIRAGKFAVGSLIAGEVLSRADGIVGAEEGGTFDKITNVGEKAAEYASIGALAGTVVPILGNGIGAGIGAVVGTGMGIWEEWFSEDALAKEAALREAKRQTELAEEQERRAQKAELASKAQEDARYLANAIRQGVPAQMMDQEDVKKLLTIIANNTVPTYTGKGMIPEDQ